MMGEFTDPISDGYNYSVEYDNFAGAFMATALNQTYHYATEAEAWRHVAVGLDRYIDRLEAALLWKYGLRQADVVNLMDDHAGHTPATKENDMDRKSKLGPAYLVGPLAYIQRGRMRDLLGWPESRPGGKIIQWAIWTRPTINDDWEYRGMADTKREAIRDAEKANSQRHTPKENEQCL